jgi:hypothetical protein
MSVPSVRLTSRYQAALRSSVIERMGSGIGSIPVDRLLKSIDDLMQATAPGRFAIEIKTIPLSAVEETRTLSGHLKTGHTWTLQKRPTARNQNKIIYTLRKSFRQTFFRQGTATDLY